MTTTCENAQPTFRVKLHIPATSWHPHYDKIINTKAPTEFEAWAATMVKILAELTHENARLMVGYWGDALNVLPLEMRKALVQVITQGLGLSIQSIEDMPDSIQVDLIERYPPLVERPPRPDELVTPKSGLVIPGEKGYTGGR